MCFRDACALYPAETFASLICFRYGILRNVAVKASYHAGKGLRLRYETSRLFLAMVTFYAYSQNYRVITRGLRQRLSTILFSPVKFSYDRSI